MRVALGIVLILIGPASAVATLATLADGWDLVEWLRRVGLMVVFELGLAVIIGSFVVGVWLLGSAS